MPPPGRRGRSEGAVATHIGMPGDAPNWLPHRCHPRRCRRRLARQTSTVHSADSGWPSVPSLLIGPAVET
eukprot:4886358-Pyramimonas_sp.AAC.1